MTRFVRTLLVLAVVPAVPGTGKNPGRPQGFSLVDWQQLREAYERHRHSAVPDGDGFRARNFGQQWLSRFDGRGFAIQPDAGAWRWGLRLAGVSGKARVSAKANRISYGWDHGLEEWFVNDVRGLEHGFTLAARREVRLKVTGGLRPQATADGVEFDDAGGTPRVKYTDLSAIDADGRKLPARMQVDHGDVVLAVDDLGARYPVTIDPLANQATIIVAAQHSGDSFGWSTSISGDYAVMGAPNESSNATGVGGNQTDTSAPAAGSAYIWYRSFGAWTLAAYLKASNTHAGDHFGYSVAISGDTVVVGAPYEDSSATGINSNPNNYTSSNAGAVYIFVRNGDTWSQQAYVKASNTYAGYYFGWTVAISGDTAIVGSTGESSGASVINGSQNFDAAYGGAGAAYVFTRSGATWSQQAYLKAFNTDAGDHFGESVAISGDTALVGARYESGTSANPAGNTSTWSGAAYVFTRSGATWSQQAYLKASNAEAGDQFGISVALSGDTAIVGAIYEDSSATGVNGTQSDNTAVDSGAAYVFVRSGAAWSQQAYLKASNTGAGDQFGVSVAVDGDFAMVGAWFEDSNATGINGNQLDNSVSNSGAAYFFMRKGSTWVQQAYLKPPGANGVVINGYYGISVAVSGTTVLASTSSGYNSRGATAVYIPGACPTVAVPGTSSTYIAAGDFSAGTNLSVLASGEVNLANNDQYATNPDGIITRAPTLGTAAYTYFSAKSPVGPPLVGGYKLTAVVRYGQLLGVWGAKGVASPPPTSPFVVGGTLFSTTVPDVSGSGGARLFLLFLDDAYTDNSGQFNAVVSDGVCGGPLQATLTHSGNFTQGQSGATYNITFSNPIGFTAGTATVYFNAPSGLNLVSMSGTGWNCAPPYCTRTDSLPQGSSYPPITATVNVPANATSPQSPYVDAYFTGILGGAAHVVDSTTIIPVPAFQVTKTHTGNFLAGTNGTYAVTVANSAGSGSSSGTVTLTENVPSGMSLVSMSGSGWTCPAGGNVCSRSDALAGGASYPVILVTVSVAANAGSPLTNSVTVSGGGGANVTANDSTTVNWPPTLSISKSHTGNFTRGQNGATYSVTVSNAAQSLSTSGTVTVTDTLPAGLSLVSMNGSGWTCPGGSTSCTRSDALVGGASYPAITVTVNVAANASSPLLNAVAVTGGGSASANTTDSTVIVPLPVLSITKSHIGSFSQGQNNASYSLVVSNAANAGPTTGTVGVDEGLPSPLTLVSMSGTGWTCPGSGAANCTRTDVLSPGASYPPIRVAVNVAANASSPQANTAIVSGGGSASAMANDSAVILTPFTDVTSADFFFDATNFMRQYAITAGCSLTPAMYCPNDNVTRAQMAIFIVRAVMGGDNFTYTPTPVFNDVPANHFAFKWVQKMSELGITAGCGSGNYCPNDFVTRGTMAVFIIRARLGVVADSTFTFPPAASFTDVATNYPYFKWIQRMKLDSITAGCGATTYCPESPVTRGQMAIFIMRGAFNSLLPAGTPLINSVSPAIAPLGQQITVTVNGTSTNFVQGTTQVSAGPGITVGTVTVANATSLSVQLTAAANATVGPRTILVTTGAEQAVLPNGLTVQ